MTITISTLRLTVGMLNEKLNDPRRPFANMADEQRHYDARNQLHTELARLTALAQAEDVNYVGIDLALPASKQCGAASPARYGRTCSRRADHVNERHRDGEISWTDAMTAASR